jgi:hypothetical protein
LSDQPFVLGRSESVDTDGDGIGNKPDTAELALVTPP